MSENYKDCMSTAMRQFQKGISREERGKLFCISAKLCSSKAKTKQEAEAICNQPKESKGPKERKRRAGGSCPPCPCLPGAGTGAAPPIASKKRFLKTCVAKGPIVSGTFAESVKLYKACEIKWKEQSV